MPRRRVACRSGAARLLAATPLLLALAACGKVGPPRPPELVIPRSPEPIRAESAPEGVKLTWRRPREYVGGDSLDDLAGFRVLRACQPEATFTEIASLPVTDQERFQKASSFTLLDPAAPLGVACRYHVIAFTFDDYTSPPAESPDVVRSVPGATP